MNRKTIKRGHVQGQVQVVNFITNIYTVITCNVYHIRM